jgi:hypothetical protein
MTLHDQQRETSLDARRGHRPRLTAAGTGRRPILTLADRLLAALLHQRLALPQVAIAALFSVRPETINKRIRDIRQLLDQAGTPSSPDSTGSPAWMIFTNSRSQKASPSHQRSRQRVNNLRALNYAALRRMRSATPTLDAVPTRRNRRQSRVTGQTRKAADGWCYQVIWGAIRRAYSSSW